MLVRLSQYFAALPAVFLDGCLYVVIAVCGFLATALGSDETYQMFNAVTLFWLKTINGSVLAATTALKMFRSTAYAEHQQTKKEGKV